MQRFFQVFVLSLLGISIPGVAQTLRNAGATLNITAGASVVVVGDVLNNTGSGIVNGGVLTISGNTVNNGSIAAAAGSILMLAGSNEQTLSGVQAVVAHDVVLNNAAGVTLGTPLRVDGAMTFTAGTIAAATSSAPLIFSATGSVSGAASDVSHVVGFVRKEGAGPFTFPTGDGTKYQPVGVNLSANSAGLTARYAGSDAGAAPYGTGGASGTPLVSCNTLEHWDLTPVDSATGTVTVFFDGYKNVGIHGLNDLRVAHRRSGQWLNEGAVAVSGTTAAGSVTSSVISAWSPFTLGSISSGTPLPLSWLSFSGSLTPAMQARLAWRVLEKAAAAYEVEKSADGRDFTSIASLQSKGDGSNAYSFTERLPLSAGAYYRIRRDGHDGLISYSGVIRLNPEAEAAGRVALYPNPAQDKAILRVPSASIGTTAVLFSAAGMALRSVLLHSRETVLDMSRWNAGIYTLRMADGTVLRVVKQ